MGTVRRLLRFTTENKNTTLLPSDFCPPKGGDSSSGRQIPDSSSSQHEAEDSLFSSFYVSPPTHDEDVPTRDDHVLIPNDALTLS